MFQKTIFSFVLLLLISAGAAVYAQDDPPAEPVITETEDTEPVSEKKNPSGSQIPKTRSGDEVVITATKTDILKKETGASVTIITGEDLERSGEQRLSGALEKTAGVAVIRNGSYGGMTSISIRGSHQKDVLVMIDGVRINDVSQINRDFDFGALSTHNIERVEIIRSGAGILYGSEASGGVINIISKKGGEEPVVEVKAGAGSHNTFRESLSSYGKSGRVNYSAFLAREDSKGISKADSPDGKGLTDDEYHELSLGTNIGIELFEGARADFNIRYTSADYGMDDGAMIDNPEHFYSRNLVTSNLEFTHKVNPLWDYRLILSRGDSLRSDKNDKPDPSTAFWFKGLAESAEFRNNITIKKIDVITIGVTAEKDTVSTVSNYGASNDESVYALAGYIQNHLKISDRFFSISGARIDRHEIYGNDMNYSQSLSLLFPETGSRLTGNIATGFKAPSLYQLFDSYSGNKSLEPEESLTWDAGLEQSFLDDIIVFRTSYFNGRYSKLIDYQNSRYINITGDVNTWGIESGLVINETGDLSLAADYTYTRSFYADTKEDLLRRARHQLSTVVNYSYNDKANINLSMLYRSKRTDLVRIVYDDIEWWRETGRVYTDLDPYYRIDLAAGYDINGTYSVFGRVENLTNNDYTEIYGYKTDGINFFAGMKAVF
jgi:vitamin B12 transporter